MPEAEKNNILPPEKEQAQEKEQEKEKVKLTWVALGILAVIVMWLISSRIFN